MFLNSKKVNECTEKEKTKSYLVATRATMINHRKTIVMRTSVLQHINYSPNLTNESYS